MTTDLATAMHESALDAFAFRADSAIGVLEQLARGLERPTHLLAAPDALFDARCELLDAAVRVRHATHLLSRPTPPPTPPDGFP